MKSWKASWLPHLALFRPRSPSLCLRKAINPLRRQSHRPWKTVKKKKTTTVVVCLRSSVSLKAYIGGAWKNHKVPPECVLRGWNSWRALNSFGHIRRLVWVFFSFPKHAVWKVFHLLISVWWQTAITNLWYMLNLPHRWQLIIIIPFSFI